MAVGQDVQGVVDGADLGRAEVDVHDLAFHIPHSDPVAQGKGAVQQDHQPAEQVAGCILRRQRDGQAQQSGTGYDAAQGQAAFLGDGGAGQHDHQDAVALAEHSDQRLIAADLLRRGGQQQLGQLRRVVKTFCNKKGDCDLIKGQQRLGDAGHCPGQADQAQVKAAEQGDALQRKGKAPQQDGRHRKPTAAICKPGQDPEPQEPPQPPSAADQQHCTQAAGSKRSPALQHQRAKVKDKIPDRKKHGPTSVNSDKIPNTIP